MLRQNGWLVGVVSILLLLGFTVRPEASLVARSPAPTFATAPGALTQCVSVDARESYERTDCLQAVRVELLEGTIDLATALARLEACAAVREDLAALATRRQALRADELRARIAFGREPDRAERLEYEELLRALGRSHTLPPTSAIEAMRSLGLRPEGILGNDDGVVERLRTDLRARAAFRAVFGSTAADDLDSIFSADPGPSPAVVIGGSVIVPNRPPEIPIGSSVPAPSVSQQGPLVVSDEAYATRVGLELRTIEVARLRYLASEALDNQRTGSIRAFAASVARLGEPDPLDADLQARIARDRAVLHAQLHNLGGRLGVDPLVVRMAGESVGLVTEINRKCESIAARRRWWIRTGAGVVTGLVGAAGVVLATGATGTLGGGLTIAAALEASVGAYLVARSERLDPVIVASTRAPVPPPADPELRRFRIPESRTDLTSGNPGDGGGMDETWLDDLGEALEFAFPEGDGVEEDGEEPTEEAPRENTIAPILPIDIPDALRELPPILDTPDLRALREMSLPEIQEKLDEFLASGDPAAWAKLIQEEDADLWSVEAMIAEAEAALELWEHQRQLAEQFGRFFIQAEVERVAVQRRQEVFTRALGRYLTDRRVYEGSADIEDLRRRFAARLVAHCRAGSGTGDLGLAACTDETALSILLVAALRDGEMDVPQGSVLGVQAFGQRFEAVLYSKERNLVQSLTRGSVIDGVVAPIYHPATFFYSYLVGHGVVPEIDLDRHLLLALPNRAMPPEMEMEECEEEVRRGAVMRAIEWIGSMFGVRRIRKDDPCDPLSSRDRAPSAGDAGGVQISMPTPRNPLQRGGGGQSGGGQGSGGSGGGQPNPLAENAPSDPAAGNAAGTSRGESGGQGAAGSSSDGQSGAKEGEGKGGGGAGSSEGQGEAGSSSGSEAAGGGASSTADAGRSAGSGGESGNAESSGSGGDGGFGMGTVTLPSGPNLSRVGRETVRSSERYDREGPLRVSPWRLREDEGMMTGSATRAMYADNARALQRFGADDLFITLAPAEVEAQRRMLEADGFPILGEEADCDQANLPPRRVFRRIATADRGYRYVFCDQNESMVIFRERKDAESYAALSAPDRPLFLARLASERLARFESSEEVARLGAFLQDPNVLRGYTKDQIYGMIKAAADLIVFQNALESALVQSMNELGATGIRGYYFDMHRQVLQAPLFIRTAESVYRLNQRLASDPLQSLAWANAQPDLARQGFFDLYHTVGKIMDWPHRWALLQERYGTAAGAPPVAREIETASLDFLQVMSDPIRVQIDWTGERVSHPAIRDRRLQDGRERTPEEGVEATLATQPERQRETEHQRGGTGGLGTAGEGESMGPERGQKPLQMVLIRMIPEEGDPDRERLPEDNQVRPGGTMGRKRTQTEESASRQEPLLWVSPHTFIDAVLSPWDGRELEPETAGRVPPLLRLSQPLREIFLRDLKPTGMYDNRLRSAMEVFTRGGWLRYDEVRTAMGGQMTMVRAHDTGRFSGAYSGNAPINDEDQIRIPNFFSRAGVVIPADLFPPVREHYTRSILGIFDLAAEPQAAPALSLRGLPVRAGETAERDREMLLRSLEIIREQAREAN
jgi:hypothetical protein